MSKLLTVVFLLGTCLTTNVIADPYMSPSGKQKYLDFIDKLKGYDNTDYVVLAMASNGCWSADYGLRLSKAKQKAIKGCQKFCNSPCEIYDVNGTSDFIKKSSSYTSASHSG